MTRSIRWSLLSWYALILLIVLGAFGTVLGLTVWHAELQRIDAELSAYAHASLGEAEEEESGDRRTAGKAADDAATYLLVWHGDGRLLHSSRQGLEIPAPGGEEPRMRGANREIILAGDDGVRVLAGRNIERERLDFQRFLGLVCAVGAGVFLLAMAGGWFLAGRALAPIDRISETASQLSASTLSKRIDVTRTENELGRLAGALNGAFDRLQASFEQQARFTADASHELRTPLSVLMAHAELALRKERPPQEYRETLEICLKASQRMRAVVEGLLVLARADASEAPMAREPVALAGVVEEAVALLAPLARDRGLALDVRTEPVTVPGDRARLWEAVSNLLANAIRYNRKDGRIDVTLSGDGDHVLLAVADTGIGIPEKDRPHICERFYRVDKARSRELGGSGLGLAITKWIVESHGGNLSFSSREGVGTTFTVRLPRAPA